MGGGNGMKSKTARERKDAKGGRDTKVLTPEEAKQAKLLRQGVGQAERMAAAAAEREAVRKAREERKK